MGLQVTTPVNQHAVPALRPCGVIVTVCVCVTRVRGGFFFLFGATRLASRFSGWACYLARLRLASHSADILSATPYSLGVSFLKSQFWHVN